MKRLAARDWKIIPYRKFAENIGFATGGYRIRPYNFCYKLMEYIITHYALRITH